MARRGATQTEQAAREERLRSVARELLAEPHLKQVDLAERHGVTQQQISLDIKLINKRYQDAARKDTTERIGKQLQMYDAIREAHMPFALQGKTRNAEIVMQANAGEAKLLGMDRPVKQEIALDGGVRVEIIGMAEEDLP